MKHWSQWTEADCKAAYDALNAAERRRSAEAENPVTPVPQPKGSPPMDKTPRWLMVMLCGFCLMQLFHAYQSFRNTQLWAENQELRRETDLTILRICGGSRPRTAVLSWAR